MCYTSGVWEDEGIKYSRYSEGVYHFTLFLKKRLEALDIVVADIAAISLTVKQALHETRCLC